MQSSGSAGCTVRVPRLCWVGSLESWSWGCGSAPLCALQEPRDKQGSGGSEVPILWWQLGRDLLGQNSRNSSFNPTKLLPWGNFFYYIYHIIAQKNYSFLVIYTSKQELCFILWHTNLKTSLTIIRALSDLKQAINFLLSLFASCFCCPFQEDDHSLYLYLHNVLYER